MATTFIISFIIYYLVLNGVLIVMIRPKFIFKNSTKASAPTQSVALAILFITSFWLGSLSYTLRMFNELVLF